MGKNYKNGSVQIGDTQMHYVSFGNGSKALVVLPGLSDAFMTVKGKAAMLSGPYKKFLKDYTVYMFSRKETMPEGYSIRDMARDQAAAMKEIGMDKAVILGVSQGGMISQYIAIDHPEIVEGLILAVTAPYANDVAASAIRAWIEMAKKCDHKSLMADTAEKTYTKKYVEKNRRMIALSGVFTKPKDYTRFFRNAYAILGFDARDELSGISCPTFIISGDDDNTVGNEAPYEFADSIPNTVMHIYKGLGHGLFDEAEDFYDRIYDFCRTLK